MLPPRVFWGPNAYCFRVGLLLQCAFLSFVFFTAEKSFGQARVVKADTGLVSVGFDESFILEFDLSTQFVGETAQVISVSRHIRSGNSLGTLKFDKDRSKSLNGVRDTLAEDKSKPLEWWVRENKLYVVSEGLEYGRYYSFNIKYKHKPTKKKITDATAAAVRVLDRMYRDVVSIECDSDLADKVAAKALDEGRIVLGLPPIAENLFNRLNQARSSKRSLEEQQDSLQQAASKLAMEKSGIPGIGILFFSCDVLMEC